MNDELSLTREQVMAAAKAVEVAFSHLNTALHAADALEIEPRHMLIALANLSLTTLLTNGEYDSVELVLASAVDQANELRKGELQ